MASIVGGIPLPSIIDSLLEIVGGAPAQTTCSSVTGQTCALDSRLTLRDSLTAFTLNNAAFLTNVPTTTAADTHDDMLRLLYI